MMRQPAPEPTHQPGLSSEAMEIAASYLTKFGTGALDTAAMMERHMAAQGLNDRAAVYRAVADLLRTGRA